MGRLTKDLVVAVNNVHDADKTSCEGIGANYPDTEIRSPSGVNRRSQGRPLELELTVSEPPVQVAHEVAKICQQQSAPQASRDGK